MTDEKDWKVEGSGPIWIPVLEEIGVKYLLPPGLLSRVAFQESSFIETIIRGEHNSPTGARGIMQLMPEYYSSVNVPAPYTDDQVREQIEDAANSLRGYYSLRQSWAEALAAYNAGIGNVRRYKGIPPFKETQNYVAQITADVPAIQPA